MSHADFFLESKPDLVSIKKSAKVAKKVKSMLDLTDSDDDDYWLLYMNKLLLPLQSFIFLYEKVEIWYLL